MEQRTIEDYFKEIDIDNDGKVSADEYFEGVKKWRNDVSDSDKPSQQLLFNLADLDDDGVIDINQFGRLIIILQAGFGKDPKSVFTAVFRLLDITNSGLIAEKELSRFMIKIGAPLNNKEVVDFIKQLDVDGDGKLSLNEFLAHFIKE